MILSETPDHYHIQCPLTGKEFIDDDWLLEINGSEPCLLRSVYHSSQIQLKGQEFGLFIFADWLPVKRILKGSSPPVTYKSKGLASYLGLKNLYITFSGYWPEKGGSMETCSFKETEAYCVTARLPKDNKQVLVVASAGNTARAFAKVCSDNEIPLLICIPVDNLDALWFDKPLHKCVKIAASCSGSDYFDAIHLSNVASTVKGFIAEGGAKNIARRDGMGTTVLSAVTTIGTIPEYYFQAIGSGTGAIAAWEANQRLIDDGRFGGRKMKLMLSQNEPFHPIYDAWKIRSRAMLPMDDILARKKVEEIVAKVLSNRRPPYSLRGGLYDALTDNSGEIFLINNDECHKASALFLEKEGIDIHPAAAIATASLLKAVELKDVKEDSVIMLNITGGGEERYMRDRTLFYAKPDVIFNINPSRDEVLESIEKLF